jgi:hypothetical protein
MDPNNRTVVEELQAEHKERAAWRAEDRELYIGDQAQHKGRVNALVFYSGLRLAVELAVLLVLVLIYLNL